MPPMGVSPQNCFSHYDSNQLNQSVIRIMIIYSQNDNLVEVECTLFNFFICFVFVTYIGPAVIGFSAVAMSLPNVYILTVMFLFSFVTWYHKGKANKIKKMYRAIVFTRLPSIFVFSFSFSLAILSLSCVSFSILTSYSIFCVFRISFVQ